MQLSRSAPLNWTQSRSIARYVARVSAFAPVGLVADEEVLICVESLLEWVLARIDSFEWVRATGAALVDDFVAVAPALADPARSSAAVLPVVGALFGVP
jgi:hypothetical protein